jgi:hypothetical protein
VHQKSNDSNLVTHQITHNKEQMLKGANDYVFFSGFNNISENATIGFNNNKKKTIFRSHDVKITPQTCVDRQFDHESNDLFCFKSALYSEEYMQDFQNNFDE